MKGKTFVEIPSVSVFAALSSLLSLLLSEVISRSFGQRRSSIFRRRANGEDPFEREKSQLITFRPLPLLSQAKLVITFVYLLVGMGVVAMCYYLLREEVTVKLSAFKERTRMRLRRLRERVAAARDRRKNSENNSARQEKTKITFPDADVGATVA